MKIYFSTKLSDGIILLSYGTPDIFANSFALKVLQEALK